MPKAALERRHTDALATPDRAALAAAVDEVGGAHVLLVEALTALRECITRPQGRNGPATAVAAARLMVETVAKALGATSATGESGGERAPLLAIHLTQAQAAPQPVRGEVIEAGEAERQF